MKNIYERFAQEMCSNCRNKYRCTEELRRRIDGSIYCNLYERENRPDKKKKQYMNITAKQSKPIMKGLI